MKRRRANCATAIADRYLAKIDMKKPTVHGPSPSRKAHLALRGKLNRKDKPAPAWPGVRKPARKSRSKMRGSDYGKD